MTSTRRPELSSLIGAVVVTGVSCGLFYLVLDGAVDPAGPFRRPLGMISLFSYPGMLLGFLAASMWEGNLHLISQHDLGLVLSVALPMDILFYFVVINFLLTARARWRSKRQR